MSNVDTLIEMFKKYEPTKESVGEITYIGHARMNVKANIDESITHKGLELNSDFIKQTIENERYKAGKNPLAEYTENKVKHPASVYTATTITFPWLTRGQKANVMTNLNSARTKVIINSGHSIPIKEPSDRENTWEPFENGPFDYNKFNDSQKRFLLVRKNYETNEFTEPIYDCNGKMIPIYKDAKLYFGQINGKLRELTNSEMEWINSLSGKSNIEPIKIPKKYSLEGYDDNTSFKLMDIDKLYEFASLSLDKIFKFTITNVADKSTGDIIQTLTYDNLEATLDSVPSGSFKLVSI